MTLHHPQRLLAACHPLEMTYYPSDDDGDYEKFRDELEHKRMRSALLDDIADRTVELIGTEQFASHPCPEAFALAALKAAGIEPSPEYIAELADVADSYEGGCPAYHVAGALIEMVWPPRNTHPLIASGTCRPRPGAQLQRCVVGELGQSNRLLQRGKNGYDVLRRVR